MKQERERPTTRREFLAGMVGLSLGSGIGLVVGITFGKIIPEIVQEEMRNKARRELENLHNSITTDYGFPTKMAKVNEDPSIAGISQTYTTHIVPFLKLTLNKDGTREMDFQGRDYIIMSTGVFQRTETAAFPSGKKFPYRLDVGEIRELSVLLRNEFRSGNPPKNPGLYHTPRYAIRLQ